MGNMDAEYAKAACFESEDATELSAPVTLKEAERSHILQTLQQTEGVVGGQNGAAVRLGLPRTTLIAKMKRLGINPFQEAPALARATASVA
jgi:transcriptional regulator with GAF, ATPase, and Fis domain